MRKQNTHDKAFTKETFKKVSLNDFHWHTKFSNTQLNENDKLSKYIAYDIF